MCRFIIFISFLFCFQAWAEPFNEVVVGYRTSTAERVSSGERTGSFSDFGFGVKTQSYESYGFSIKLGLMYERRTTKDSLVGINNELVMNNLDLLTHVSYKVVDGFSVFAGPNFSVVLNHDCKPSSGPCLMAPNDPMKYFVPVQAGLDFGVMENYGVEAYYEWISQEYWENTFKNRHTYGLNLKYKF